MASIVISGDTSGSVTLQAPAIAGSTVVTLPTVSMNIGTGGGSVATNTAFGASALAANQAGGTNNTAIGNAALDANTTGDANTAVGDDALGANTTASRNTAVGYASATANTTGTRNTGVGAYSLYVATTGNFNTAIGDVALEGLTTGSSNTAIGIGSGGAITTGSKNTIIGGYTGNQGGLDIRTSSNHIVLSDGDGNPRLFINSTPLLVCPAVYNNTAGSAANVFVDSSGGLYRSTSSLKYKRDVQDATHGLAEVLQLRPVTYKGKAANDGDTVFGGLIAEEVHAAGLTEFVQYAADGSPDALAYGNMVSVLVKAIQEQQSLITTLTTRITALEAKVGA